MTNRENIKGVALASCLVTLFGGLAEGQLPDHPVITEVYTDPEGLDDGPIGRDPLNAHQEFIEIYLPPSLPLGSTLNKDFLELTFYEVEGDSSSSGVDLVNYRFDLPPFDLDISNGQTPGTILRPPNGVIVLGWLDYADAVPTALAGTPNTRIGLVNGQISGPPADYMFIAINGNHFSGTTNFPSLLAESLIDLPGETVSGVIQNGSAAYLLVDRASPGYVELYDDKHIPIGGSASPNLAAGTVLQTSALLDGLAGNDHSKFDVIDQPLATPTGDDIDLETSLPLSGAFSLLVPQIDEDGIKPASGVGNGYARIYMDLAKTTENGTAFDDDPVADAMNAYRVVRNNGPFFPTPGKAALTSSNPELSVALSVEQAFEVLSQTTGGPGVLSANVGGDFGIDIAASPGPSDAPTVASFSPGASAINVPGQSFGFPTLAVTPTAQATDGSTASAVVTVTASNSLPGDPTILAPVENVTVTATVLDPIVGRRANGQPFQTTVFAAVQPLVSNPGVLNELLPTDLGGFLAANLGGAAQDTQGLGTILTNPLTDLSDPLLVRPWVKQFPDNFIEYINPAGPPGELSLVQTVLTSAEVGAGNGTYDEMFTPTNDAIRAIRMNIPDTTTFGGTFSPSEAVHFASATGLLGDPRSGLSNATTTRTFEVVLIDTNVRLTGTIESGATDDVGIVVEVQDTEASSSLVDGQFVFLSFSGGLQGADLDGFDVAPDQEIVTNLIYLDLDNLHDVLGIRTIEALWLIDAGSLSEPEFIEAFSLNPAAPPLTFDDNNDGSVNLADLPGFDVCLSGPVAALLPGCLIHDIDGNSRIDLLDAGGLQVAITTP